MTNHNAFAGLFGSYTPMQRQTTLKSVEHEATPEKNPHLEKAEPQHFAPCYELTES